MTRPDHPDRRNAQPVATERRTMLHKLLFSGVALGAAVLTCAAIDPKLPPFVGE